MKKTFIATSVLGLMAVGTATAAGNETVNVTFVGEVKDLTCTVQVGGPNNVVNLGMLDAVKGAKGTVVPVMFRFSDCDQNTKLESIVLSGAQNGNGGGEDLDNGVLGTDRNNVTVKIMKTTDGKFDKDPVSYKDNKQVGMDLTAGGAATPYYAQLQADPKNAPMPGTVNSNAFFTVVYQ